MRKIYAARPAIVTASRARCHRWYCGLQFKSKEGELHRARRELHRIHNLIRPFGLCDMSDDPACFSKVLPPWKRSHLHNIVYLKSVVVHGAHYRTGPTMSTSEISASVSV